MILKAEAGEAEAQYNLGVCYYDGRGVVQSSVVAKRWFEKAAAQGFEKTKELLKKYY